MHALGMRLAALWGRRVLWRLPVGGKEVFLTFDDGPEPSATPWVLDTLAQHGAKATFFCLGAQVARWPELFRRLQAEGHAVGHHSWDHPDGWRTPARSYYRNVLRGQQAVGGTLFRPPYGRIRPGQLRRLAGRSTVVLWDVLSGDFRRGADGKQCAQRVLARTRPGSILVFHDNVKSRACLQVALPLVLEGLSRQGYTFGTIAPL